MNFSCFAVLFDISIIVIAWNQSGIEQQYALAGMIDKNEGEGGGDNLIRATNNSIYLIIYK